VFVLVERFGVSERRACRVVGQHRSTPRRSFRPRPLAEDKVRRRLRYIARDHPRWGWKTALRDWCRLHGTTTSYIELGSPWENPFVESFNGRARDELLNIEEFGTLLEAQVVVEARHIEYDTYRPHSSLGGLTPAEYAKRWTIYQPTLP
jgi:transposase InsO family protein